MISGLNWIILHGFVRNSSFTGQVGLIIASSRSGMCFSSCKASSIYLYDHPVGDKEKYIEDVKQEEKDVPDLLEAIMRPTCLVKEELRPNLFKLNQFRPEITKIRV